MANTAKTGYVNGSDLLLKVGGKVIGHCTSHKVTYNSDTKEHTIKPVASAAITKALFKGKTVTGMSVSISAEGIKNYDETENGFKELLAAWYAGASVEVSAFERESDTTPYLEGNFVISSLEEDDPAQDDSTYSISLENDGDVDITASALTENAE